ncbi:hypothetical protein DSECCO2_345740 [anaerobic digester metagenome]
MEKQLDFLNRMLLKDLSPSQTAGWIPDQFRELLDKLKVVPLMFPARWEYRYEPPLTPAHRYYAALTDSDCNRCYNHAYTELRASGSDMEREYLAHQLLERRLSPLLRESALALDRIAEGHPDPVRGIADHWQQPDPAYIYGLIKAALICLYLNIQEIYSNYIKEGLMDETGLRKLYFKESMPADSLICPRAPKLQPIVPVAPSGPNQQSGLNPVNMAEAGTMLRKLLVNEALFYEVISLLKEYGVIDENNHYIPNRQQNNARCLAVTCDLMVSKKGFFRNSHPELKKKILKEHELLKLLYDFFGHDLRDTGKKLTPEQEEQVRRKLPRLDRLFPATRY